MKNFPTC